MQTLEHKVVVWVFLRWTTTPFNIVSDSFYVVGIVQRIERSMIKAVKNNILQKTLLQLYRVINQHPTPNTLSYYSYP